MSSLQSCCRACKYQMTKLEMFCFASHFWRHLGRSEQTLLNHSLCGGFVVNSACIIYRFDFHSVIWEKHRPVSMGIPWTGRGDSISLGSDLYREMSICSGRCMLAGWNLRGCSTWLPSVGNVLFSKVGEKCQDGLFVQYICNLCRYSGSWSPFLNNCDL